MTLILSELAIHIPVSIQLFEKYDFNYYQNGNQTFKEACEEKGLIFSEIDAELSRLQLESKDNSSLTLEDMSIDRLIDFINGQYHSNETENLSLIQSNIQNLINDVSCEKPLLLLLINVENKFIELKEKLVQHCDKEDKILFPQMRKLVELRRDKSEIHPSKAISLIKKSIQVLESEHIDASNILSEIKKMTNKFAIPLNAPKHYKTLMENLKEFESDLHVYLHIENNILFPKIISLEEELNSRS